MSLDKPSASRLPEGVVACFYAVFTLLPGWAGVPGWVGSNSLVLSYPWVSLWQLGLAVPIVWLLWLMWRQRQWPCLGHRLDWLVGFAVLGCLASALQAVFPQQALWYTWAGLGLVAALYALSLTVTSAPQRDRLLTAQGSLNLAFILVSLGVWAQQTWLPELARLQGLQQSGIDLSFSFIIPELRNWSPTGHPNYVAGYLLLALPLLLVLGWSRSGWQRWLWWGGTGLGLLNLYTTSSRTALVGLAIAGAVGLLLLAGQQLLPRLWLGLGGLGAIALLSLMLLTNSRLRSLIMLNPGQAGGEAAYRVITAIAGWQMVQDHPWLGAGLGTVPLLYQRYRPAWAGREAELVYQLHNTPLQIWAELGLWGMGSLVGAIALLVILGLRWLNWARTATVSPSDRFYFIGLYSGLSAYGVISLTDYQLDNLSISGSLVVAIAVLTSLFRESLAIPKLQRNVWPAKLGVYAGLGCCLAALLWLIPIHRAWNLSSQAFTALARQELPSFVRLLTQAHHLAPWEPYYSQQLAWNLGDRSLQASDPDQRQEWVKASIAWFQTSIQTAPDQEFSHTNLAWLLLPTDPGAAAAEFARSAQLVPAKRGVFYGLGLSLLAQGKSALALEALTLEALIDPIWIASPLWQLPPLRSRYPQVLAGMESTYTNLLAQTQDAGLKQRLYAIRGGLFWWQGDLAQARRDWQLSSTPLCQLVLDLAEGKPIQSQLQTLAPPTGQVAFAAGAPFVVAAWVDPQQRRMNLARGWAIATRQAIAPDLLTSLQVTMEQSTSFDQWLKQKAPTRQFRRERSGFSVLSRHVDGPAPVDFPTVLENIPLTQLFSELLPASTYAPDLDRAIQAQRDHLIQQVLSEN